MKKSKAIQPQQLMTKSIIIEKNLSGEERANVDFLYISNYLRKDDSVKKYLLSKLKEEAFPYVAKPSLVKSPLSNDQKVLARGEWREAEKRICSDNIDDNIRQIIQALYDKETTYGDFIGTILERAVS